MDCMILRRNEELELLISESGLFVHIFHHTVAETPVFLEIYPSTCLENAVFLFNQWMEDVFIYFIHVLLVSRQKQAEKPQHVWYQSVCSFRFLQPPTPQKTWTGNISDVDFLAIYVCCHWKVSCRFKIPEHWVDGLHDLLM